MPGFSKDKTKLFVVPKKIRNGPEQKHLDEIFLVLIENVLLQSRILFQKLIYSIFFGTKAAKRKLSILKERWFDIARKVANESYRLGAVVMDDLLSFNFAAILY